MSYLTFSTELQSVIQKWESMKKWILALPCILFLQAKLKLMGNKFSFELFLFMMTSVILSITDAWSDIISGIIYFL